MKKRIFTRALALLMALSLLSTTAFAASFADLQDAINGTINNSTDTTANGTAIGDTGRYGYAWNQETNGWGIEAWNTITTVTGEDGTETTATTRNIQLNETVKHTDTQVDSVRVSNGQVVTIDLNGNNIDNNNVRSCAVVAGSGGNLTIKDTGENGEQGAITGGNAKSGGGVLVETNGSFTLESGNITGNTAQWGGGVLVRAGGSFTMNGGSITNNTASGHGGGINAQGDFTITSGTIANNKAACNGGGIYIVTPKAEISNATIEKNEAGINGGGIEVVNTESLKISDSVIESNVADDGGGIFLYNGSNTPVEYSLENVIVRNNTAKNCTGGVTVDVQEADTVSLRNNLICGNKSENTENVGGINSNQELDLENNTICGNTALDQPSQIVNGDSTVSKDSPLHQEKDWSEWTVTKQATPDESGEETRTCSHCGAKEIREIEYIPDTPDNPDSSNDTTTPDADIPLGDFTAAGGAAGTTTITDEEVPLAGLLTLADLLEELRQYEETDETELPGDFQWIDHEYAQAIYWGLQEELVVDTEDDPLNPDELLTVGLMREVLTNFVELYHGLEDFEVVLEGEDEDLVMDYVDMISRLAVFYEDLEAALEAKAA